MISLILFSEFSDLLPALTGASAIGNLWSISSGIISSIPLAFCCLLKLKIFSTVSTVLYEFSFSGSSFLITVFLKLINPSLIFFNNCSFLACVALIKAFAESDGFWYLK